MSFSHRDSGLPLPPPPRNTTVSVGNNHHPEDPNISSNISDISAINNNHNNNQQSHNNNNINNISSSSTTSSSGLSLMERNARRASRRNSTTATNNFPPLPQQQQRPSHFVDRSPSVRIHPDLIAIRNNHEEEQQHNSNLEEQEQDHRPSDIYSDVSSRLSTVVSSSSTHSSYHQKNSNNNQHAHEQQRRQTQAQIRQDLIDELEKEDNNNNQQHFRHVNYTNEEQQQHEEQEENFSFNNSCEEDLTIKTLAENLHCDGRILEACFSSSSTSSSFHEVSDLAQSLFDALEQDEIATRYAREKQQLNDQTLLDTARTIASLNQTIEKLEDEGRYYQDKYSAKLIEWKKEKEDEQSMAQQYSRQVRDRSREFDKMVSQLNKKEVEFERLMKMNKNPSDGLRRVLGERRTNC